MRYLFILFMGLILFASCENSTSSSGGSETWMLTGATMYDTPDCSGEGTTGMCAALDQTDFVAMFTCMALSLGSENDCNGVETCSFMTYYELLGNQVYTITLDGNGGAILNTSEGCTDGLSTSASSCNNNGGGWVDSNTVNGTYTESSSSDGRIIIITDSDLENDFDVQLFINGSTATVYIPDDDDDDGIADSCMEGTLTEQ